MIKSNPPHHHEAKQGSNLHYEERHLYSVSDSSSNKIVSNESILVKNQKNPPHQANQGSNLHDQERHSHSVSARTSNKIASNRSISVESQKNPPHQENQGSNLRERERRSHYLVSDSTSNKITSARSIPVENQKNPPLQHHYGVLVQNSAKFRQNKISSFNGHNSDHHLVIEECELPLIDLEGLITKMCDERERQACCAAMCKAACEWGFFQVVNHGIKPQLLRRMRREQVKLFDMPFEKKATCGLLNNSYRWGSPTATRPNQFSWSEAFHIPLTKISEPACWGDFSSLREVINEFAAAMSRLSGLLAGILAENLGHPKEAVEGMCDASTCFLRLNHYPLCPKLLGEEESFGLVPHTDSDFLTILYQDQVGGLQLMKDSKWLAVTPIPDALIVNIGDLFQAWSNDEYKSVEHKVMTNNKLERYSTAYFLCPSYDTLIGSCKEPSMYRKFTFGEYRSQIQDDVKKFGHKIGLSRFLL